MSNLKTEIPPVICSLFVNDEFIGSFDNPINLLSGLDFRLNKTFYSLLDLKEDNEEPNLGLCFSVINSAGYPDVIVYDEENIENRSDIIAHYDRVIEYYRKILFGKKNNNSEEKDDIED